MASDYDEFDRRDDFDEPPREDRAIARGGNAVRAPAIVKLVVAICGVLFSGFWIYQVSQPGFDDSWDRSVEQEMKNPSKTAAEKQQYKDMTDDIREPTKQGLLITSGVSLIANILIGFSSILLLNLKGRGFGYLTSILMMLPVVNCCCIVGLPVGIWMLVTLGRPEVKAGFRAAR